MPDETRIRVFGQLRKEPDLKALAKAVVELARLLEQQAKADDSREGGR